MVKKTTSKSRTPAAKGAKNVKATKPGKRASKALKDRYLASVCAEIESKRTSKGRIPKGEVTKVFNDYKPIYSWLTIDILKKGLKKFKGKKNALDNTIISDLTEDSGSNQSSDDVLIIPPPISIGFVAASENDNNKGGRPEKRHNTKC